MKTKIFIALAAFFAISISVNAQCDNTLIDSCKANLGETIYLKHFKVRFAKGSKSRQAGSANFSVYLTKGTLYKFTTANDKTLEGKAIIKLYDDFRFYGGNIDEKSKTIASSFGLLCQKTGIYYLTIKFHDEKEGCAAVMLSMKEQKRKYEWDEEKPRSGQDKTTKTTQQK